VLEVLTHVCKRTSPESMTSWHRACGANDFRMLAASPSFAPPFVIELPGPPTAADTADVNSARKTDGAAD
jgi:hypothetical protein